MRRKNGANVAGLLLIVALICVTLWLGVSALIKNNEYRREASVTATPSFNPGSAAVTEDPAFPTATPTPCILQMNSVGKEVKQMQQRLLELGFYTGAVDGQFGSGTQGAVIAFQRQHGLKDDGAAGELTLSLLYTSAAQTYYPVTPSPAPAPTDTPVPAPAGTPSGANDAQAVSSTSTDSAPGASTAPGASAAPDLNATLATGSQGDDVKRLQTRLKDLGFYSGRVDGDFGKGTKTAVRAFQQQHDLDADGIAGKKTLAALYADTAKRAVTTATPEPIRVIADSMPLLVNKEYPIDADFVPADLVAVAGICDASLLKVKYEGTQGVRTAVEALRDMLQKAAEDGVTNWQLSAGYRSYADQESIFNSYVNQYIEEGKSRANAISRTKLTVADPGASEHHTGLAFDLNVPGTSSFKYTEQCKWLHENCWAFGFIIRYTDEKQDITGFLGEEWHVRYVGVEHSLTIRDKGWCLEEYLQYAAI